MRVSSQVMLIVLTPTTVPNPIPIHRPDPWLFFNKYIKSSIPVKITGLVTQTHAAQHWSGTRCAVHCRKRRGEIGVVGVVASDWEALPVLNSSSRLLIQQGVTRARANGLFLTHTDWGEVCRRLLSQTNDP